MRFSFFLLRQGAMEKWWYKAIPFSTNDKATQLFMKWHKKWEHDPIDQAKQITEFIILAANYDNEV